MTYLFCPECENRYKTHEFCPECSIPLLPLSRLQQQQRIKGNGNQAIQIGGDNKGDVIINQSASQEPTTLIQRETVTPLTIGGTPVKNWWLFVSGAIPLVANLFSIFDSWRKFHVPAAATMQSSYSNLLMYSMSIGALLLISAVMLQRSHYMTLLFGRTIERGKDGSLYLTRVGGTCGLCDAPVRVKTVGPKECRQTRVICTNNPDQHQWVFDHTVLRDVGEDYQQTVSILE